MTTTTNIQLSTPAHGSNVDTWDADPINNNSGILDAIAGSATSKALSNVNVTLTVDEARVSILRFSGVLTGNVAVNVGAIIKEWTIFNTTTGAFVVTITGGSGKVVGVPPGNGCKIAWDGTDCFYTSLPDVGTYIDYAGTSVPGWYTACTVPPFLLCDGSTFNAATYPCLNAILGGTTLPDLRGRTRFYLDGGTNRITTAGSGIDGGTRFSSGGAQNKIVAQTNLPAVTLNTSIAAGQGSHAHSVGSSSTITPTGGSLVGSGSEAVTSSISALPAMSGTTPLGGSGTALQIMPPTTIGGITMIRAA